MSFGLCVYDYTDKTSNGERHRQTLMMLFVLDVDGYMYTDINDVVCFRC